MTRLVMSRLVIAGVSVRAFTESAVAAGFAVTAIDAYGDLDLRAVADVRVVAPYTADAAARMASALPGDGFCYTSNFENHPEALGVVRGHLLGNPGAVLARARDPLEMARALATRGIAVPAVRASAPRAGSADSARRWMRKPRASGGGHGVAPWRRGMPVPRHAVLQERVVGEPMSVLFAADGRRATVFGVTRQLIGDPAFGATGFKYCGNILLTEPPAPATVRLAEAATAEFGLVGVNGIDCVGPIPVEINPRYTAAMELVERRDGLSIAATHVRAFDGQLPSERSTRGRMTHGKAIVYARRAVTVGDTRGWLADPSVRDIPHPGQRVSRGTPICSVFAVGRTAAECYRHLVRRAERIYQAVDTRQRRAA
jgi:uncharacterized protein